MSFRPSRTRRVLRHVAVTLAATVAIHSSAAAQSISASFYTSIPNGENPNAPYGGTPFCTATVGGPTGLFLAFTDAATRTALCGANAALLDPAHRTFSARFTGSIYALAAGTYDLSFSADDGEALSVDGVVVDNEWFAIKGGGPGDVMVNLNAGNNQFVLDYNQRFLGGAFVRMGTNGAPLAFGAPEPSSVVLMGSGLFAISGAGWIKRRRRV